MAVPFGECPLGVDGFGVARFSPFQSSPGGRSAKGASPLMGGGGGGGVSGVGSRMIWLGQSVLNDVIVRMGVASARLAGIEVG